MDASNDLMSPYLLDLMSHYFGKKHYLVGKYT